MATSSRPPMTRIQNSSRSRNSIRKVMLKPAIAPYSVSAVAAPKPDIRPEGRPLDSVREAQRTFTGPTGTAIAKPAIRPLESNHRPFNSPSILMASASLSQVGDQDSELGKKPTLISSFPVLVCDCSRSRRSVAPQPLEPDSESAYSRVINDY